MSYWKNDKRPRVTLGITDDSPKIGPSALIARLSLAQAREKGREALQDARLGLDPAAAKRERRAAPMFEQLARDYVERHAKKKKSPKGAREDENRINKVLIPRWGDWKAGDVRRRDVVELLDEYEDASKVYARNRMAALVSKVFNLGLHRDVAGLEGNPAHGLVDADLEKPRKRVLSDDELETLLSLFAGEGLAGLGFRLLLLTGQRPSEVFGMEWGEIDSDLWAIPKARTKNRRSKHAPDFHLVPLSHQAREVLNELRGFDGSKHVFPSPTKKNTPFTNYAKHAAAVKEAAGLDQDWRVYDLRTAAITGMQELGTQPHVLSAIANHISTGITQKHYAHSSYLDEKREALVRWGAHVEKLDPAIVGEVVELGAGR